MTDLKTTLEVANAQLQYLLSGNVPAAENKYVTAYDMTIAVKQAFRNLTFVQKYSPEFFREQIMAAKQYFKQNPTDNESARAINKYFSKNDNALPQIAENESVADRFVVDLYNDVLNPLHIFG